MQPFVRDRYTWLAYLMLGYYAYLQATLGPLMPFLSDELALSYTVRGLHLSAFALGMILAGWLSDRVAARWSRRASFWVGAAGMAVGGLVLTVGAVPAVTIGSSLLMGLLGSFLLVTLQASLAEHHGPHRSIPLTESNVVASVTATIAPFLISQLERVLITWRVALWVGAAAFVAAWLLGRQIVIPEGNPNARDRAQGGSRLPPLFWMYWLVVLLSVSVEWCTIFWAADFMERVGQIPRADAVGAMAIFFAATVIGRFAGSRLTRRIRAERLLIGAALVTVIGFPLFWLGYATPLVAYSGLFLLGLGIANLFPLTLSAATTVGAASPDAASGRTSLAAGLAILIAPQVLGTAADSIGIYTAFAITGGLAVVVLVLTLVADRFAERAERSAHAAA